MLTINFITTLNNTYYLPNHELEILILIIIIIIYYNKDYSILLLILDYIIAKINVYYY